MLPPIIRAFSDLYPGVDIEITESDTNLLYTDSVQAGIDLILDGGTCDTQLFDQATLFNECVIFAVPRTNPINQQFEDCILTYDDIVHQKHRTSAAKAIDIRAFENERLVLVRMTPMDRQALVYYVVADPIAWREVFIAWHRKGVKTKVMERFIAIAQQVYDPKHWLLPNYNS